MCSKWVSIVVGKLLCTCWQIRKYKLTVSWMNGLFPKKSTPPQWKACWKISRERGLTALEIQMGGGLWIQKYILGVTFDFINVSIASINKFLKNCFAFSNFITLSNYRPLTTLFCFKFPSIGSPSLLLSSFVEASRVKTCKYQEKSHIS